LTAENGLVVENLNMRSAQADRSILDVLRQAGVRYEEQTDAIQVWLSEIRAFEFDATHCPDLFPPLAVLAAFADGVSVMRGVTRLIHKESNRAKALQQEFSKAGVRIVLRDDEMKIYPAAIRSAQLNSHNDHRMAMAAALLGLAGAPVDIQSAEVVSKSFPDFYARSEIIVMSAEADTSGNWRCDGIFAKVFNPSKKDVECNFRPNKLLPCFRA